MARLRSRRNASRRFSPRSTDDREGGHLRYRILIALERGKRAARELLASLMAGRRRITVPVAVIAEWWRGSAPQTHLRKVFTVEDMNEHIAMAAGMALGAVPTATAIDATVMASAAIKGDTIYTTDFDDLVRLRDRHFHDVRVLSLPR